MELNKETVRQAIKTVICVAGSNKNATLFGGRDNLEVQISVKKVPQLTKIYRGKFVLAHSLYTDDSSVCFFVKGSTDKKSRDFDKQKDEHMAYFKKAGILAIKEVIPIRQLELEFQPYEAKRKLSNAFDGFLADERIFHLLRPLLGKHFYGRHRNPVPVKVSSRDMAVATRKALKTTFFNMSGHGACCMAVAGALGVHTEDELVENVLAMWEQFDEQLPGGRTNVRTIVLKTTNSKSVPLYTDFDYESLLPVPDLRNYTTEPEAEEIDTIGGATVKVYDDGRIELIKKVKKAKRAKTEGEESSSDSDDEDDEEILALIEEDEKKRAARATKRAYAQGGSKRPFIAQKISD